MIMQICSQLHCHHFEICHIEIGSKWAKLWDLELQFWVTFLQTIEKCKNFKQAMENSEMQTITKVFTKTSHLSAKQNKTNGLTSL